MQFLHCKGLIDPRCILACSAKKDCVPCKAGKALHVKRLGGKGSQGIKSEKKGKMRKGRRKENQRWCIITRVGHGFTVKPNCWSVMQDVNREAHRANAWVRWNRERMRRKEVICRLSNSFLLMVKVCASEVFYPRTAREGWTPWTQLGPTWVLEQLYVLCDRQERWRLSSGGWRGLANPDRHLHWSSRGRDFNSQPFALAPHNG